MDKTAVKNFSIWARNKLIADIKYKAGLLGITKKEIKAPLPQSTQTVKFFDIGSKEPYSISGSAIEQRRKLADLINSKAKESNYATAYKSVIEEVAYTWFNRLIAIRFMEANDYLPTRVRVLSSESDGKLEPDLVTHALDIDLGYTAYEKDKIAQLKHENKLDELFRMLFIKQCNALNDNLPELFEKTNDYTELLLNVSFTDKEGVVYHLVNDIAEDDFNVSKEGQVEIIGWLYQYYNTEPKQEVFDGLKKNKKITKDKIPAATQLFTPHWIVRYMVENSLGRLWIEGHPNEDLKSNWKYYLDEAEQEPEVIERLKEIRQANRIESPEEIRLIDPCMGSGHILVYAFDVLMQIYESEGYAPRDAARLILEKNIYGLDIDKRAYQLAYFSLMMKARQYNRRIISEEISPQIYQPAGFPEGEEYGSLVKVDVLPPKPVEKTGQLSLEDIAYDLQLNAWNFKRLLSQKYDVVVTNPPYMGNSGMGTKMSDFVKRNYPDSKSDLFAVFIEKCSELLKTTGYQAMITQHAWMFLSSYEKLRNKLLKKDIVNMVHLGARAFEEIGGEVVQTTAFVLTKRRTTDFKGAYVRLVDYNSQDTKEETFLAGSDLYTASPENFEKIPGSPVAYWVSDNMLKAFKHRLIADVAAPRAGLATGDNTIYQRFWYEVDFDKIGFGYTDIEQTKSGLHKWFPCDSGGDFRKWATNNEYVVNWEKDGQEIRNHRNAAGKLAARPQNAQFYFKRGLTWNKLSSSRFSVKYKEKGSIYDDTSRSAFPNEGSNLYNILGLLCSCVSFEYLKALNPTMSFTNSDIERIPYIPSEQKGVMVNELVSENISLSHMDWDSFETSWDFKKHPLLTGERTVDTAFAKWKHEATECFETLKTNEEELNRIFIDIYGLQDELTPEVANKDVTVAYIYDKKEDIPESMKGNAYVLTKSEVIKSFISYAIGCMLGRYSLDIEGLAYTGGDWDDSKYKTFIPDSDNIIPITDEEYFSDDVLGMFVDFVRKVYGHETLEENLDFIAEALGSKGSSSRVIIRNYILKDFYKDHIKTYQKRPIYWLFDSGKQNGFKALIYMHRYDENTIGNLRIEYLHKIQRIYENEILVTQDIIDNSSNAREVAAANKRKDKLIKQLQETKEYDEKIAHLALSRISIDLDDGVKVNYEKVQTDRNGKKYDVLSKI
ncbi:MAG: BREX-1 system adenine-specific DNA-methyltransferase PglX [Anaerovoracaceae bacterium]|jgi:type II restriction/modification system DNA methylase subunit YeeA